VSFDTARTVTRPRSPGATALIERVGRRTGYRVLYQRSHNLLVLLHALEKNTGAIPAGDIAVAKQRMRDFKARMNASPRAKPRAAGKDAPPTSRNKG
jgi:phage-related protein